MNFGAYGVVQHSISCDNDNNFRILDIPSRLSVVAQALDMWWHRHQIGGGTGTRYVVAQALDMWWHRY